MKSTCDSPRRKHGGKGWMGWNLERAFVSGLGSYLALLLLSWQQGYLLKKKEKKQADED